MEHLSMNMERQNQQEEQSIQWRRDKVLELTSQGHSQRDISTKLQIGIGTVNRDLAYIKQQSRLKIRKYIDETLPEEYEKCLVGITSILKEAWTTSQQADSKKEKIHALALAKECYSMKLDLLTNATVVNDAMKFVSDKSKENLKKLPKQEEERDSNEQQSKEEQPDYDEDQDQLEEKQEEETGEISTETVNQVF
jgi:DNA-binding CsgD family transcriptional regulator